MNAMCFTPTTATALFRMFRARSAWTFVEDGRSFALADFDHDGRQEVFLKNRNAPQLRLLKNVIDGLAAGHRFPPARHRRVIATRSARR